MDKTANKSLAMTIGAVIVIIIVAIVVVLLTRNKHSNNSSSFTTQQMNADKQQITTNWQKFFAGSTSLQDRERLLQNGNQFAQTMQAEFSQISSQSPSATVNSISFINSSSANVYYTVSLSGQTVLSNQKGGALLVNNTWVVSDATLCQLLSLGGSKPSVCQGV